MVHDSEDESELRRRICKKKANSHWEANTHCEEALGIADAMRRRIGRRRHIAKMVQTLATTYHDAKSTAKTQSGDANGRERPK